jgi:hypothetical protein
MFLDLKNQPPANRNTKPDDWLKHPEPMYPLKVYLCEECNLVQLLDVVPKEELFSDYPFVSSGSGNTPQHFIDYARELQSDFLKPDDLVVEIGGNDGVLLCELKDVRTINIEPAQNIAPIAESRGVKTINEFFTVDVAKRIVREHGKAKLVLGNNSIPHIDDQTEVMNGIKELLADDGVGIIQSHYLGYIFDSLGYGDIYHEHMSYYAIRPLMRFYEKFDMNIFDYKMLPFHGVSMRHYFGHANCYTKGENVQELANDELRKGWDKFETYEALAREVKVSADKLISTLTQLKKQGKRIAAYGAAAKGVPILNYAGITNEIVDFCVDGMKEKQGMCMPMSHIPIISPEEARTRPVDYYLLLAWSFRDHIVEKEKEFVSRGGKFIMPIGDIEVF